MGNETKDHLQLYDSMDFSKQINLPLHIVDIEDENGDLKIVPGPILHAYEWSDFPINCTSYPKVQSLSQSCTPHWQQSQEQEQEQKQELEQEQEQKPLSPRKTQKKSVSFSNLEIREHNVIFGDHPCSSKLPISLGWEHASSTITIEIDSYESSRKSYRRVGGEIRLSEMERKNLLKRVGGLTELDIKVAQSRHNRIQRGPVRIRTAISSSSLASDYVVSVSS